MKLGLISVAATLSLVCAFSSNAFRANLATEASAESWTKSVADFLTDRNFYSNFPAGDATQHFSPIVRTSQFEEDAAVLRGRDPERGVLFLHSDLRLNRRPPTLLRIGDLQIVMPLQDTRGREVFPALLKLLRQRLRSPDWVYETDRSDPERHFWRKGTSRYVIHLHKNHFSDAGFVQSGPGPWVIAGAGEEEGDSEEP